MTYGVLPSQDDFIAAFIEDEECEDGTCTFGNDPRVGNCDLTANELWDELSEAHEEYSTGKKNSTELSEKEIEEAGDWCSMVLYSFGFEWI